MSVKLSKIALGAWARGIAKGTLPIIGVTGVSRVEDAAKAAALALLFLMGYPWWGDVAHEWAGAGMFALFIAHHILNAGWWRSLGKGRYTPARVLQLVIDLLVLLAMLGLMVSGVMLSNHVFAFLPISGGMSFARLLHMASVYWGFVLLSLHLGLHWNMILGMVRPAAGSLAAPQPHCADRQGPAALL